MAKTRKQENRSIRQEELREKLAAQGHLQHVVDCADKIGEPECEKDDVYRWKTKADIHMKLVDKYLPALQAVEVTGEGGDIVEISAILRKII